MSQSKTAIEIVHSSEQKFFKRGSKSGFAQVIVGGVRRAIYLPQNCPRLDILQIFSSPIVCIFEFTIRRLNRFLFEVAAAETSPDKRDFEMF